MTNDSKIEGLKALSSKLSKLGQAAGGKSLRSATNRALTPVVNKARANAPVGTQAHQTHTGRIVAPGFLKRNVAKKVKISKDKTSVSGMVGVKPEAFYGVNFIELGWTPGKRTKGIRALLRRGTDNRTSTKVRANPWLEPAFESSQAETVNLFGKFLKEGIDKARR